MPTSRREAVALKPVDELARRPDGDRQALAEILHASVAAQPIKQAKGVQQRETHLPAFGQLGIH